MFLYLYVLLHFRIVNIYKFHQQFLNKQPTFFIHEVCANNISIFSLKLYFLIRTEWRYNFPCISFYLHTHLLINSLAISTDHIYISTQRVYNLFHSFTYIYFIYQLHFHLIFTLKMPNIGFKFFFCFNNYAATNCFEMHIFATFLSHIN